MTTKREILEQLNESLGEIDRRKQQSMFYHTFPDKPCVWQGHYIHPRSAYPAHMEFIGATKTYREVGMMASNRSGKTHTGAFSGTAWLTGEYPDWWSGRVFNTPIRMWASGKTGLTTRDIIQKKLLGDVVSMDSNRKGVSGTGMIPGKYLVNPTWRSGIPDAVDTIQIKHVSGGVSTLGFKSYEQGRGSFEGTEQHIIWLDEEPPADIASECLTRTATVDGLVIYTFTPLNGMSEVARGFLPGRDGT